MPGEQLLLKFGYGFDYEVAVLGDSFVEEIILPHPDRRVREEVRCWRVPSGAYLVAAMLKAIPAQPLIWSPPEPRGLEPALVVKMHRRDEPHGDPKVGSVRVASIHATTANAPFISHTKLPDELSPGGLVVFCDTPRLGRVSVRDKFQPASGRPCVVLTHHPESLAKRLIGPDRAQTVIVLNASSLRDNRSQCQLSTLSCEQAAIDLRRALAGPGTTLFDRLRDLAAHVVVALSPAAALYCHLVKGRGGARAGDRLTLVYRPKNGYDAATRLETSAGFCAIMTVGIVEYLSKNPRRLAHAPIIEGVKRGLTYSLRQSERGYGPVKADTYVEARRAWFESLFTPDPATTKPGVDEFKHEVLSIPGDADRPGSWSLLGQACTRLTKGLSATPRPPDVESLVRGAIRIAEGIIYKGLDKTAKGIKARAGATTKCTFPYAMIGSLSAVDRREIEDYQSIRNLMRRYLDNPKDGKPLCLAAFGPPGSGKSTGIREAAASLAQQDDRIDKEAMEFNLAGFASISGLTHALHKSRDRALAGRVPLVLLDEFDSSFDGKSLGWLKYLLAPMQDGRFQEGDAVYNVGRTILVFIGGTRRTFQEFAGQMRNREFIEAKGPDFVSRLRGHVNVRGINRIDDADYLYIVRRAVALRFQLQNKFGRRPEDRFKRDKEIDGRVLRALLKIETYHHGVRSLEQIIRMAATDSPRRQLTSTSLPPHDQLDMHVDAARFWEILKEERQAD